MGPVKCIPPWVAFIVKGEIQRKPSSTMMSQLWQGMKWQDATLVVWSMEVNSGNIERAIKHFIAMQNLIESGSVSRESIGSTLTAYNNSCAEMRSEERDTFIRHW